MHGKRKVRVKPLRILLGAVGITAGILVMISLDGGLQALHVEREEVSKVIVETYEPWGIAEFTEPQDLDLLVGNRPLRVGGDEGHPSGRKPERYFCGAAQDNRVWRGKDLCFRAQRAGASCRRWLLVHSGGELFPAPVGFGYKSAGDSRCCALTENSQSGR